ncbi:MAG: penicillin acylase family protein [Arenimonas sp.]
MRVILKRLLLALTALVLLLVLAAYGLLRASLPVLDGERALPGLQGEVGIERDGNGTVTVRAGKALDSARALGFVHAQERYFEMDLLRRSAAGELSALFGPMALDADRKARVHRLRARIRADFTNMAGKDAALLQAYADGVNAGLDDLSARPWPYLLLNAKPEPWRAEDSFLVGYAMFFDLQDEANEREFKLWQLQSALPEPIYALLTRTQSAWDAPLYGLPETAMALPDAGAVNLNTLDAPQLAYQPGRLSEAVGSNNFAVSGALTADGRAIVADDMHLGLRAPNIWFRARLLTGTDSDVSGFTLPGIPAVIVGSNRHVAWGFTNSYGDFTDFMQVRWTDAARTQYLNAQGRSVPAVRQRERIAVKGGEPVVLEVLETEWGPVTRELGDGRSLALMWTAHRPGAMNLGLAGIAKAKDLDNALTAAESAGIPGQNLVIGDRNGRIAWRLTAQLPKRVGACDWTRPVDPRAGCDWQGWLPGTQNPALVDPPSQRLWTANGRVLPQVLQQTLIGNSGYAFGARGMQIRDALMAKQRFTERDLLAIQTDDRALFLTRWWRLLDEAATRAPAGSALRALHAADPSWDGTAAPDSVSYRVTRAWRLEVSNRIEEMLLAPAIDALGRQAGDTGANGFDYEAPGFTGFEDVVWTLLERRPTHLLTRDYRSWDELLERSAETVRGKLAEQGPLAQRDWGERNTAAICHPLAAALPTIAKPALCMPADRLRGDADMPLVAAPGFGASERMVVSPGHEEDGIIHMPGGQSGHILSPFWGAGHADWVQHKPTPFLPGKAEHRLRLQPGK